MEIPSSFLTLETLRTLAGQAGAVMMLTAVVRASFPSLSTYWIRTAAMATGIALHMLLTWERGMPPQLYAVALINGALVAMLAMKSAEFLKGNGKPEPPPAQP